MGGHKELLTDVSLAHQQIIQYCNLSELPVPRHCCPLELDGMLCFVVVVVVFSTENLIVSFVAFYCSIWERLSYYNFVST